nr:MAG TPA_asm: hypothetical protein [Caudoviricetes sp.]
MGFNTNIHEIIIITTFHFYSLFNAGFFLPPYRHL